MQEFSITPVEVHQIFGRQSGLDPPDVFRHQPGSGSGTGQHRNMRRDMYFGMRPKIVIRGQRLGLEDIQRRAEDVAWIDGIR